jgi:hypothetical protein
MPKRGSHVPADGSRTERLTSKNYQNRKDCACEYCK